MPAVHRVFLAALTTVAALLPIARPALASPAPSEAGPAVRGADISWPQCPKGMGIKGRESLGLPMPGSKAQFVVIGLTNGPGFTRNPCLADQVAWAASRRLPVAAYSVVSYPTAGQLGRYAHSGPYSGTTRRSQLRNVGYAQARANVAGLRAVHLRVPHVWVDVEVYPFRPWTPNLRRNAAVVRGALEAYGDAGLTTGLYSTPLQFASIVGRPMWRLPEWHTAGPRGRATAMARCTERSFNGGRVVLAQWWTSAHDHDLTCPQYAATTFGRYFTR